MKKNLKRKGFTLIELIVVMAVIGILVLLAAPKFLGYTKDAKVTAMQSDAKILSNAALMYNIDKEVFPVDKDADEVTLSTELKAYLTGLGYAEADTVEVIDESLLGEYVKNIKNEYTDYVLVTSGALEGEVFHVAGVSDKEGTAQYGIVVNK